MGTRKEFRLSKPLTLSTCSPANGASSSWNRWIGRWGCSRTDTSRLSSSRTTSAASCTCLRLVHRSLSTVDRTSEQKSLKITSPHVLLLHLEICSVHMHLQTMNEVWTSVNSIEKLQLFKSWHQRKRPWRLHQKKLCWVDGAPKARTNSPSSVCNYQETRDPPFMTFIG